MRYLQPNPSKNVKDRLLLGSTDFSYVVIDPRRAASRWISSRPKRSPLRRDGDNYLRQMMEACGASMVAFNEAAASVHANKSWRDFAVANGLPVDDGCFGLTSLRCSQYTTLASKLNQTGLIDHIRWLISTGQREVEQEYVYSGENGSSTFVARVCRFDYQGSSGAAVRILVTLEDVTKRRTAEDELRSLSGRLINAQEQERCRLARDLHDHVNQRLAVLSIELEQMRRQIPEAQSVLCSSVRSVLSRTRELASDIHRLSYQLHPFKLEHLGLGVALRSLCDEFASHHEVCINFRQCGSATLPSEISLCLFRIAQEALSNLVKHSGAGEGNVELIITEESVRLQIWDSGRGFDVNSPGVKERLGLTSMKERLRLVGGEISIDSKPGRGTEVEVRIPLDM